MATEVDTLFSLGAELATAKHPRLGLTVELYVPLAARQRSAVKAFRNGVYHEPFSHWAYTQILQYKTRKNAVHAGTYFGDMLDTFARAAGSVFAFEPVLESYFFAKRNMEHLGLKNIYLFNAGLGCENSLLEIAVSDTNGEAIGGAARFRPAAGRGQRKTQLVPVFKIDSLPIYDVGLIQLDVEGTERDALEGALNLIRSDRPIILVEDNASECSGLLEQEGYKFVFKHSGLHYWSLEEDLAFVSSLAPSNERAKEPHAEEPHAEMPE